MQKKSWFKSHLKENKIGCHAEFISASHLVPNSQSGEILKQVQDDDAFYNGGFTLIELLVVVLIIGILAAVAVPQYHLAVNKSRFANLRTVAQAYTRAVEVYYLANGSYPNNFDELSVDLPAGNTLTTSGNGYGNYACGTSNDMYCCIVPMVAGLQSRSVTCGRLDYSFVYQNYLDYSQELCGADNRKSQAIQLCKSFGGTRYAANLNLIAPGGHQGGAHWDYYIISQ